MVQPVSRAVASHASRWVCSEISNSDDSSYSKRVMLNGKHNMTIPHLEWFQFLSHKHHEMMVHSTNLFTCFFYMLKSLFLMSYRGSIFLSFQYGLYPEYGNMIDYDGTILWWLVYPCSGKLSVCYWSHGPFSSPLYPHKKWWCSIVMLVYHAIPIAFVVLVPRRKLRTSLRSGGRGERRVPGRWRVLCFSEGEKGLNGLV